MPYEVIIDAVKKGCERQESADDQAKNLKRKLSQVQLKQREKDNEDFSTTSVDAHKALKRYRQQQAGPSLRAAAAEAELGDDSESSESGSSSRSESELQFEDSEQESNDNQPANVPEVAADEESDTQESVHSAAEYEDSSNEEDDPVQPESEESL